jgi:NAD(P)H-dependent flavin oxidoreductase YrpB (nitropropane dioxygenase family)
MTIQTMPDTSTPHTPAQPTHWLARQFNLPLPVLQAPMAGVQDHVLALAVARAGGLGAIPAAMLSPAALGAELAAFRAASTAPLNVNFFLPHTTGPRCHGAGRVAGSPATLLPGLGR